MFVKVRLVLFFWRLRWDNLLTKCFGEKCSHCNKRGNCSVERCAHPHRAAMLWRISHTGGNLPNPDVGIRRRLQYYGGYTVTPSGSVVVDINALRRNPRAIAAAKRVQERARTHPEDLAS